MKQKLKQKIFIMILLAVSLIAVSCKKELTYNEAAQKVDSLLKRVQWNENFTTRKVQVNLDETADINSTLPDINLSPMVVDPADSGNSVSVEIFVSPEKSGKGTDGWIVDIANAFNNSNANVSGKKAIVRIRSIASGTGMQYIASKKYIPDAFSPSCDLWVKMIQPYGIKTTLIDDKLVGNVAGIVMKTKSYDDLKAKYGNVDIKTIVNAVVQGDIAMGYTNPFASSTGLNLLLTVLYTFSNGDMDKILSDQVVSAFSSFQTGVPYVALTTMQMRDSVQKGGALDAFVLEYQTFVNTQELKTGYVFIPFGVRHDNPLYAIGNIGDDKIEVLKKFSQFTKQAAYVKVAKQFGFDLKDDYTSQMNITSGDTILTAQKIWKEKKDSGREIEAVFLCDISGSMNGEPIQKLKAALTEGSKFINKSNSIGLVTFNQDVTAILPIKKFNLNQQASFQAAVEDMYADGSTAMYNGITVALKMLIEEKKKNNNIKPLLFILTDGESNTGLGYSSLEKVIKGLKIPVYTIGYNNNIKILQTLSSINEAANINAQTDDVVYKIGALLNAQM
jgi:Ca-activated chloride channel homolog